MTELYPNIKQELRDEAQLAWDLALHMRDPVKMTNFLNAYTEYHNNYEEQEFLRFFFNLKMEEAKL